MNVEHDVRTRQSALAGQVVVDGHLQTVGTVTLVLDDERETTPRWAVVRMGVWRGEHYVPLADTYVDHDGRLVVPFDKTSIKHAPHARGDHVISVAVALRLRDYYGIAA
jgi:hypothetical protein